MKLTSYRELIAWQKAMDLTAECYRIAATFPRNELYGLGSQLQRASVSVPSNIAEGQGRLKTREFLHFLGIANGSRCEVETQLLIAHRVGQLPESELHRVLELSAELGRLIHGLINSLRKKSGLPTPLTNH